MSHSGSPMKSLFIFIVFAFLLSACSPSPDNVAVISGSTMGTTYSIRWPKTHQKITPEEVQVKVDRLLNKLVSQMSTYDENSELSQFNAHLAPFKLKISREFSDVMALSFELNGLTNGYFDVSVGPIVNLWGFGPDKHPVSIPSNQQIIEAHKKIGLSSISLEGAVLAKREQRYIDLSAIAKGFAVDEVARLLDDHGIDHYLVEIGGEMLAKGVKQAGVPWKIAIESPDFNLRSIYEVLELSNIAVATSGDYRNYFELDGKFYSHSINPKTGNPTEHKLASVTVLDKTCANADALATAMLVMGLDKAKELALKNEIKAYMIVRDEQSGFKEYMTPAFEGWVNQQ